MGQKVNPIGLRLGIVKSWDSRWFADKKYAEYIFEDHKIRKFVKKRLYHAGVSRIEIERSSRRVRLLIFTSRPGIVIGKKGAEIERLKTELRALLGGKEVWIEIDEIKRPDSDAYLVADHIARQIERRVPFRRALKKAIQTSMDSGVQGIKVQVSGRLGGAEIARAEWYKEGRIPLHTIKADIDYGTARAETTYGSIGVKVWINRGEEAVQVKGA